MEKSWTAPIRRLYSRLRSGHDKELKDYRHRFLKIESSGLCIHCDMETPETIEHVLCECKLLETRRREIFKEEAVTTEMLTSEPVKCLNLLSARFKKLKERVKMVEDEGGGSQGCSGLRV